jgi:D-alanyl-D-alanine carboxypeptidase
MSGSVAAFVDQMNERAKALGCKNTHFTNPNGLWNKNHYTTPYDMALIMQEAMKNNAFRTIAGAKRYEIPKTNKYKKRELYSHHHMVFSIEYPQYGYEYAIAGKTGYTSLSEATLVTSAKKGDMELICVVMKTKSALQGEPNIFTDTIDLFDYSYERFSQYTIDESVANNVVGNYIFTKFSPFFSMEQPTLALDGVGSVILPKKVPLQKAQKKVDYFPEPKEQNGNRIIGELTYTYNDREAGGVNIIYNETNETALLTDSIDMNQWVEEAVVKASTPPFPWRNVLLIIASSAVAAALLAVIIIRIRHIIAEKRRREGYKKAKTTEEAGILYKK